MEGIERFEYITGELRRIRTDIALEREKVLPLEQHEAELRAELLALMKESRIATYKDVAGALFGRIFRTGIEITDEAEAMKWAKKNDCVRVDSVKAQKLLKGGGAIPKGFAYKETEVLRIVEPKE